MLRETFAPLTDAHESDCRSKTVELVPGRPDTEATLYALPGSTVWVGALQGVHDEVISDAPDWAARVQAAVDGAEAVIAGLSVNPPNAATHVGSFGEVCVVDLS